MNFKSIPLFALLLVMSCSGLSIWSLIKVKDFEGIENYVRWMFKSKELSLLTIELGALEESLSDYKDLQVKFVQMCDEAEIALCEEVGDVELCKYQQELTANIEKIENRYMELKSLTQQLNNEVGELAQVTKSVREDVEQAMEDYRWGITRIKSK